MQICNDADLGTEYSFPQNQNITGKAPRLLPCSSIASCPDQGSDLITTSQTGEEKEYPDHKWYYMFLRNRELKRYIEIFTGRRAVMINTRSGMKEERYFCFKVFSYTSADHKRRFERCPYSKEEYAARRESAFAVKEAFYCLVAGLPDLSLEDGKLNYTVANFKSEIYSELSEKDRKLIDLFYLKFDNANLLKLLKDKEATTDFEGNYSQNELLALISSVREGDAPDKRYPSYLYEFITAYLALSAEELYRAEDMLSACYYAYAMNCGNQFVSSWFEFNLNINNILAALAARKYKMDVSQVVVGKTDVSEMIRTSNARDFGLSEMLEYFEQVLRISEIEELVEREKKIDLLKWNWMEDAVFFNYFTVERIFVFLLKLEMIGRWISMDKEKGSELFRQIIDKLKDEIQIPAEFR